MIDVEIVDGVGILRLEHGKVNAIDLELTLAVEERLAELQENESLGTLVLTGTGSVFSAGVDLYRLLDEGEEYVDRFLPAFGRALLRLFRFPKPVVAAINGHAIAGGCIVACACDHRIMARGPGTLGVPELRVGVPFPQIAIEVLRFATSDAHLQELVYQGRTYSADEARERGLVDEIVTGSDLLERSREVAAGLATEPTVRFRVTKEQLRRPALERIESLAPSTDPEVLAAWKDPGTRETIRSYLEALRGG
ncbi:MAG: enoyl-CoA hydratase/isomerase family protein [Thermoanaerobaculia bacterium]|nr:enoyl-CoA hydratase/isomerase family protein [Thermoanaerobaculia bacterium]